MTCSSDKVVYKSRHQAKVACKTIKSCGGARRVTTYALRPYQCRECGGWHLTSQTGPRGN